MSLPPWMYVVLLGLICLVYAQLLPRKENKTAPSGEMMKELEQSMELFASDMEQQNESLLQLFSETKRDYEGHLSKLSGRLEQLEKQNQHLLEELSRPRTIVQAQAHATEIPAAAEVIPTVTSKETIVAAGSSHPALQRPP